MILAKILANGKKMGYNIFTKENRIVAVSGKLPLDLPETEAADYRRASDQRAGQLYKMCEG